MKRIATAIAVLAGLFGALPALAGEVDPFGPASPSRTATAPGATGHQGRASRPRRGWPDRGLQYLESQLLAFRTHTRDNPFSRQYMWGAVTNLSPSAAHDVAVYFSMLYAQPTDDGDRLLAAKGRALYREGIPVANVPSCVACHGPNGQGIRGIPRLGGQSYYYLKRKLAQWGEGYHLAAARPMPGIASKLSPDAIEALASYLSFVR